MVDRRISSIVNSIRATADTKMRREEMDLYERFGERDVNENRATRCQGKILLFIDGCVHHTQPLQKGIPGISHMGDIVGCGYDVWADEMWV